MGDGELVSADVSSGTSSDFFRNWRLSWPMFLSMNRYLLTTTEREISEPDERLNGLARAVVDAAFEVHRVVWGRESRSRGGAALLRRIGESSTKSNQQKSLFASVWARCGFAVKKPTERQKLTDTALTRAVQHVGEP